MIIFSSRMTVCVSLDQCSQINVDITHGGVYIGMAHKSLNRSRIGTVLDQC
jgi:hypothetical protein